MISAIIGFPPEDTAQIQVWTDDQNTLWNVLAPVEQHLAAAERMAEYTRYLQALIDERRVQPREDLLSDLIDTADAYRNEALVGRAIAHRRDEVGLASKFGLVWHAAVAGGSAVRADAAYVRQAASCRVPDATAGHAPARLHNPVATAEPNAPPITLGLRRMVFAVEEIDEVVARLQTTAPDSSARWLNARTGHVPALLCPRRPRQHHRLHRPRISEAFDAGRRAPSRVPLLSSADRS